MGCYPNGCPDPEWFASNYPGTLSQTSMLTCCVVSQEENLKVEQEEEERSKVTCHDRGEPFIIEGKRVKKKEKKEEEKEGRARRRRSAAQRE